MSEEGSSAPVLLYVLHCGNLYGTERMALATVAALNGYAHRVVVAPPPWAPASVASAAIAAGFESVTFHGRMGLVAALLPWFRRHRSIDVIGTGVVHTVVCDLLGRLFGTRLRQLHVAHGGTPTSLDKKRALNRWPVTVVAVSPFVARQLVERGVRADRIEVIDNFLSDAQREAGRRRPRFDPASPQGRPIDPDAVRVAVVSRVDPIKRIDLLLDAADTRDLRAFRFDVYGVGTELDAMKARAGSHPNIVFHGYVPDVAERLAAADLMLQLCPVEPFGLAVLEAFLARVVAIVPDSGGASGLVDAGISGLKFAADDVGSLVGALERARSLGGEAMERMADAAAAALEDRFSQTAGGARYARALARRAAA